MQNSALNSRLCKGQSLPRMWQGLLSTLYAHGCGQQTCSTFCVAMCAQLRNYSLAYNDFQCASPWVNGKSMLELRVRPSRSRALAFSEQLRLARRSHGAGSHSERGGVGGSTVHPSGQVASRVSYGRSRDLPWPARSGGYLLLTRGPRTLTSGRLAKPNSGCNDPESQ